MCSHQSKIWLVGILGVHCALMAYTAAWTSPTFDEPSHLAAGLYVWRTGQCDLYAVNPPLVKVVAAIPVLVTGFNENWLRVRRPPARTEMNVGIDFVAANQSRILWMTTLARWACIPFCVLGGAVCYIWSNRLFGSPCGWIALLLWCFSPTILGNGAVISADVASASVGVLACYLFWRWLDEPTWERAMVNGLGLGICWLVKLTWVILPFIWILVWLAYRISDDKPRQTLGRGLLQIGVSTFVAILLLNVGYAFEGSLTQLGDYQFTSGVLGGVPSHQGDRLRGNRFRDTLVGSIPVPVPSSFVYGLDAQKQDFEESRMLYFAGHRSHSGWWYFYPLSVLLKEPLGTLLLGLIALLSFFRTPRWWATAMRQCAVWIPPLVVLLLVSSNSRLNYYRYLTPTLPFAFVWISQIGQRLPDSAAFRGFLYSSLSISVMAGLASVPHSLSFVNVLGGGTTAGHYWFADCNFDWGQDLPALREWIRRHPEVEQLHVAYFGMVHPLSAGIEFRDLPPELINRALRITEYRIPAGWYAISVSHLRGIEGHVHNSNGGINTVQDAGLTVFESETPIDRAGPSILIFHIQ